MAVTTVPNLEEALSGISPKEYAIRERISTQAAYLRCWRGQIPCKQILGRWVIFLPKEEGQQ